MQKIISWNVASVRARMPVLTKLLEMERPDVVFLQEIKAEENTFPFMDLLELGYHAVISGQKSYNGVAILTRNTLSEVVPELPSLLDADKGQARFIQATLPTGEIVISVYVPNGNPPEKDPTDTTRLAYKLRWLEALIHHISDLLTQGKTVILGGDFNVIEKDTDVYNPESYRNNALMVPPVREMYAKLCSLPLINAIRLYNPDDHTYSFWDFQMGAWARNWGMLLDALFVSQDLAPRITGSGIYKQVRGWEKTSDHAPVFVTLKK